MWDDFWSSSLAVLGIVTIVALIGPLFDKKWTRQNWYKWMIYALIIMGILLVMLHSLDWVRIDTDPGSVRFMANSSVLAMG